ncbi:MAG: hypothetical protein F4118_10375, partial [Acidimicrobiaceae bacterium]|nr:hypothetical protein [Acidimicrobiaceae bacterium]
MLTQAARDRKDRRNWLLTALGRLAEASNSPSHLSDIYEETQKVAREEGRDLGVTEQTISNDLKNLSGKKLPSTYKGKVRKIKNRLEWRYVVPKQPILAAYGYRWKRNLVVWDRKQGRPKKGDRVEKELWGKKTGDKPVNFAEQVGIYLLHDGRRTVYVGRIQKAKSGKRGLYDRLFEHTKDGLKDDWEKFSWFGFLQVDEDGSLSKNHVSPSNDDKDKELEELITTIE